MEFENVPALTDELELIPPRLLLSHNRSLGELPMPIYDAGKPELASEVALLFEGGPESFYHMSKSSPWTEIKP